ncbi:MAG TPA: OB-fold nucleic acid binding domain-containing protein [Candidatus Bathyarchaeia archaeon]
MSDSFETILNHILSQNPTLPKEELLSLVERKKQESHGLLSDEGAIRLVAQQMSLSTFPSMEVKDQRISSVQAGLMDASITGEVVSVSEQREFPRSEGATGKVLRTRLVDSSGEITCVLWDAIAEFVAGMDLGPASRVRFEHGYTKYGRGGEVEFHLGSRSSVQVLYQAKRLEVAAGLVKVADLAQVSDSNAGLVLRILKMVGSRSEKGPVQALCEDETGMVIVKFWDEAGEAALSLREGSEVLVQNARVAERNGLLYVNVGMSSTMGHNPGAKAGSPRPVSLGSLKAEPLLWVVSGKVVERSEVREIETREGRKAKVSNVKIEDGTGRIRVSLWDKHAETVDTLRLGDMVKLVGVRVRKGFAGDLEASTVFLSQIEKLNQ